MSIHLGFGNTRVFLLLFLLETHQNITEEFHDAFFLAILSEAVKCLQLLLGFQYVGHLKFKCKNDLGISTN